MNIWNKGITKSIWLSLTAVLIALSRPLCPNEQGAIVEQFHEKLEDGGELVPISGKQRDLIASQIISDIREKSASKKGGQNV